jgi:hypothetical protein
VSNTRAAIFTALLLVAFALALLPASVPGATGAIGATGPPGTGSPFYVVPTPQTKECTGVAHCVAVTGPWIVIPAHQEATYLLRCPQPHGYFVGGTDARASSTGVRVWFDGQLGAPIGAPSTQTSTGAALLFHATANNHRIAWFQPVLGCIDLTPSTKRSTLSAPPGAPPSVPLDLRAVGIGLAPSTKYLQRVNCAAKEKFVGWWHTLAFFAGPPNLSHVTPFTIRHQIEGGRSLVVFFRTSDVLAVAAAPYPEVVEAQIGVTCAQRARS